MKNILPLLFFAGILATVNSSAAEPSRYTANYVRGHSVTELGKKVSIDVSWVQPVRKSLSEEFVVYAAHTWDERQKLPGGIIPVVMPASEEAKFVKRYETSPDIEKRRGRGGADFDTRRLSGTLQEGGSKVIYIDLTDGAAADAKLNLSVDNAGSGSVRERFKNKFKGKR